mmetsp:Transcript_173426/g.556285  ORF Transcript_173426/g.556285 Transcript_173426/m.556285 type:complete len:218 (+) Transcript_173426:424-1077(+)
MLLRGWHALLSVCERSAELLLMLLRRWRAPLAERRRPEARAPSDSNVWQRRRPRHRGAVAEVPATAKDAHAAAHGGWPPAVVFGCPALALEVIVEDHVVVVLRPVPRQSEVLRQEADELRGRPVVRHLGRMQPLLLQHGVKDLSAEAAALAALVHVEVQGTHGVDLPQSIAHARGGSLVRTSRRRHKETLRTDLKEAQCQVAFCEEVDALARQVRRP